MSTLEVSSAEANRWWQRNDPAGALLNKLLLLFIIGPIALVFKELYGLSLVIFAFIVPYGFFLRFLAVRAVRKYLAAHPEAEEAFQEDGILL